MDLESRRTVEVIVHIEAGVSTIITIVLVKVLATAAGPRWSGRSVNIMLLIGMAATVAHASSLSAVANGLGTRFSGDGDSLTERLEQL